MLVLLLAACDALWIGDEEVCEEPRLWFRDADGDGYGRPTDWVWGCAARDEYTAFDQTTFDCDDDDPRHSIQCAWAQVTTGAMHSCALSEQGGVTCWGVEGDGAGDAPAGDVFSAITAGEYVTCGIRAPDSTVACWGSDAEWRERPDGTLHLGDYADVPFVSLSAGLDSACGVMAEGGAVCFGLLAGLEHADAVVVGTQGYGVCFLEGDGSISCNGTEFGSPSEDDLADLPPLVALDLGFDRFGCGLDAGGELSCFGTTSNGWSPTDPGPTWQGPWLQVVTGRGGACGIVDNGEGEGGPIECWGEEGAAAATPPAGSFIQLSYAVYHACALSVDGEISCWGTDQFGDTNPPDLLRFIGVQGGGQFTVATRNDGAVVLAGAAVSGWHTEFSSLSAGPGIGCGLDAEGSPQCWFDESAEALRPPSGVQLRMVDLGPEHGCGVRKDAGHEGAVLCWGDNSNQEAPAQDRPGPYSSVTVGRDHSCALLQSGAIDCWGLETEYTPLPEGAWLAVAATEAYGNCAIPAAGEGVQCWGGLSWDASVDAYEIQAAPTTGVWTDLQSGALHWCALDTGGQVDCFGATVDEGFDERWRLYDPPGTYTQLGIGTASNCATRTSGETYCWGGWLDHYGRWAAPADETFTMLAQGEFFGCGLHADGTFTCWGEAPAYPPHLESISAGRGHACGLSDQGVVCFGANGHGEVTPPVGASLVEVDAGAAYTCGRTAAGAVTCWGDDAAGLVSSAPATEGHLQVAAGRYQACALEGDGRASCWGDVAADPPRTQFAALTTGARHACGLTDAGIVECWGDNSEGQLTQRGCPDEVAFTAVSAGDYHTCGLCEGGGVVCWGLDAHGQVSGVEPWKFLSVSAGAEHTCGLKSDGIVVCWGRDLEGQTDIGYPWTY